MFALIFENRRNPRIIRLLTDRRQSESNPRGKVNKRKQTARNNDNNARGASLDALTPPVGGQRFWGHGVVVVATPSRRRRFMAALRLRLAACSLFKCRVVVGVVASPPSFRYRFPLNCLEMCCTTTVNSLLVRRLVNKHTRVSVCDGHAELQIHQLDSFKLTRIAAPLKNVGPFVCCFTFRINE